MSKLRVKAEYSSDSQYFITPDGVKHNIASTSGPYDYLLGALSGCFYLTFKALAEKIGVVYSSISFDISCTKRTEKPTTMDHCLLLINANGVSNKELFESAIEKTSRYCSIYYTLSHVAAMEYKITYDDAAITSEAFCSGAACSINGGC